MGRERRDGLQSLVDSSITIMNGVSGSTLLWPAARARLSAWMLDALSTPQPTPTTLASVKARRHYPIWSRPDRSTRGPGRGQSGIRKYPGLRQRPNLGLIRKRGIRFADGSVARVSSKGAFSTSETFSAAPAQRSLIFLFYNQTGQNHWVFSSAFYSGRFSPASLQSRESQPV